jgi:Flp pilus assembly protein TadB
LSKERAQRRAAREKEAAIRAAARAAEAERRERRQARKRALRRIAPSFGSGRPTGILARRRRTQNSMLFALLLAVNILVWVVRPDWAARIAVLIVTVLAAPVLATLLFRRR